MARAFLINEAAEAEIRRADNIRMRRMRYNIRTHARPLQLSDAEFMALGDLLNSLAALPTGYWKLYVLPFLFCT